MCFTSSKIELFILKFTVRRSAKEKTKNYLGKLSQYESILILRVLSDHIGVSDEHQNSAKSASGVSVLREVPQFPRSGIEVSHLILHDLLSMPLISHGKGLHGS